MKSNERAYKLVVCLSIILLYFLSGMSTFWAPIGGLCLEHSYKRKSSPWRTKEVPAPSEQEGNQGQLANEQGSQSWKGLWPWAAESIGAFL